MPQDAESGKKTDSVMKVAEALDLNVLTSHSIQGGTLKDIDRIKGNFAPDPVSSLLNFYKSFNNSKRTPNWAGAAFSSINPQHV